MEDIEALQEYAAKLVQQPGTKLQALQVLAKKKYEIVQSLWKIAGYPGNPQEGLFFKNRFRGNNSVGTREWTEPPPGGTEIGKQKINARSMATEFMPVIIHDKDRGGKMPGICIRTKTHLSMEEVMEIQDPLLLSEMVEKDFVVAVNICRWTTQFAELDYAYTSNSRYLWDQNRVEHLTQQYYNERLLTNMRAVTAPTVLREQIPAQLTQPPQQSSASSSSTKQKAAEEAPGTPPSKRQATEEAAPMDEQQYLQALQALSQSKENSEEKVGMLKSLRAGIETMIHKFSSEVQIRRTEADRVMQENPGNVHVQVAPPFHMMPQSIITAEGTVVPSEVIAIAPGGQSTENYTVSSSQNDSSTEVVAFQTISPTELQAMLANVLLYIPNCVTHIVDSDPSKAAAMIPVEVCEASGGTRQRYARTQYGRNASGTSKIPEHIPEQKTRQGQFIPAAGKIRHLACGTGWKHLHYMPTVRH